MSKLSRIVHDYEEVVLGKDPEGNEIKARIYGFVNEETVRFLDLLDKDVKEAYKYAIRTALIKDDPTITDEEINKIPGKIGLEVANIVTRLSGLGELFSISKKKSEQTKTNSEDELKAQKIKSLMQKLTEE